jgi:hypothetical protein
MRKVMMMAAGLVGVALVSGGGAAPAFAGHDYPWCVQGRGVGYPGECSYETFEQCRASASGRSAVAPPSMSTCRRRAVSTAIIITEVPNAVRRDDSRRSAVTTGLPQLCGHVYFVLQS